MRTNKKKTRAWRFWALLALLVACGSRTGLAVDEVTAAPDASTDAPADVRIVDASPDRDADADALPLIDASKRDADRTNCPDADSTLVYVVAQDNTLRSFYPPTATFTTIGRLACPAGNADPFSMAIDRKGVAWVLFDDGHLFQVSTLTAACTSTSFQIDQFRYHTFGMGFVALRGGASDTLFIAGARNSLRPTDANGLATIAIPGLAVSPVGDFVPAIDNAELTGTGDGRLFGFYSKPNQPGMIVGEIDPTNARLLAETPLATVNHGNGWAFGFWGGDFYLFVGTGAASSNVVRFRPSDNSVATVGTVNSLIVGAGVSTCAPQN